MAKKQTETPSLLETFRDFNQTKNIDDTTLLGVLEESFRSVIAKIFGTDENFTVVVNPDKGDFEITRSREIVADDEVEDPNKQLSLKLAASNPTLKWGKTAASTSNLKISAAAPS